MSKWVLEKCLVCFVVVTSLLSLPAVSSSSDAPFIVAHKKATLTRLKSGAERLSVSVDIYNQGSSTAYDITLNDDSWSKDIFDVVTGNTSMSWERLDVGALLSHAFGLEAKPKLCFMAHLQLLHSVCPPRQLNRRHTQLPSYLLIFWQIGLLRKSLSGSVWWWLNFSG